MNTLTIKVLQDYYIEHNDEFNNLTQLKHEEKKIELASVLKRNGAESSSNEITEIIESLPTILEGIELPDHLMQAVSGGGKLMNDLTGKEDSQGKGKTTINIGGDVQNTNIETTKNADVNIGGSKTNTTINRQ